MDESGGWTTIRNLRTLYGERERAKRDLRKIRGASLNPTRMHLVAIVPKRDRVKEAVEAERREIGDWLLSRIDHNLLDPNDLAIVAYRLLRGEEI